MVRGAAITDLVARVTAAGLGLTVRATQIGVRPLPSDSDTAAPRRWADALSARIPGGRLPRGTRLRSGEPRGIGSAARGRDLLAGRLSFGGPVTVAPGVPPWDASGADPTLLSEAHEFGWLADLAALAEPEAVELARDWTRAWIDRFGRGRGPGWTAQSTGRRALAMVQHAATLRSGDAEADAVLARSLARQAVFLARRWRAAPPGRPRVEALTGLIHALLALGPLPRRLERALAALERAAAAAIDEGGAVASRSPEDLLEVLARLAWTTEALAAVGRTPPSGLTAALERGAPVLRALIHADGGLARFHGGDRGAPGLADQTLFLSGVRRRPDPESLHMGFARLRQGPTTLILDAAPPPRGSRTAHASTLAFEVTAGSVPLVVGCGPGGALGPRWRRAGRVTASHATLSVDGYSSSRFGGARSDPDALREVPRAVRVERRRTARGVELDASHDGYEQTHGLTHVRRLELHAGGRRLDGEDTLVALDGAARARFDQILRREGAVRFAIRFHLHPSVEAALDAHGRAVSLRLPGGAAWRFRRVAGAARLALESSVYLERGRTEPRPAWQVVLFSSAGEYATRIAWSLRRVGDAPPEPSESGP